MRGALLFALLVGAPRLTAALDPARRLDLHQHDIWRNALPHDTVSALLQTRDGYLWIATHDGLVRYDGHEFEAVDEKAQPLLANRAITALYEDGAGVFWIGTESGLVRYDAHGSALALEELQNDTVTSIVAHGDRGLWLGSRTGLIDWSGGRVTRFTGRDGLAHDEIQALAQGPDGNLWIGTARGLERFVDGRFVTVPIDGEPFETRSILAARDGAIWVATSRGVYRRQHGAWIRHEAGPSDTSVTDVFEDSQGTLWLSTSRGPMAYRDGRFQGDADLPKNTLVLAEDREGNLWYTTGHAVGRLRNHRFVNYRSRHGLSSNSISVVTEARGGGLWVGTRGDGLTLLRDGEPARVYGTREGLPDLNIRTLWEDADGTLWIGSSGLHRLKDGRVTALGAAQGLTGVGTNALFRRRDGTLLVSRQKGGLLEYRDGTFRPFVRHDAEVLGATRVILEDAQGALWLGAYDHGLLQVQGGEVVRAFGRADGVPGNVYALHEDGRGSLWIGTHKGLCRLRDGRIAAFPAGSGLPADAIFQILDDGRGTFWLTTARDGVARVAPASLQAVLDGTAPRASVTYYDDSPADGMETRQCSGTTQPAGVRLRDGRLAVPTGRGLTVIDPSRLQPNTAPLPVTVDAVLVDERPVDLQRPEPLPSSSQRFEFQYNGVSLLSPTRVVFRHRLEGFDADWVDSGTRRSAFYNSLPAGRHTFRVQARHQDGRWSDQEARVSFVLATPPWRTVWAQLLYVIGGVLLLASAVRVREGVLRRQNRLLEEKVQARTAELGRALEQLERSEANAVEASRAKSVFLANMSHELRTPLSAVLGFAQLLERDRTIVGESREGLRIIQSSGQHLLGLITDVLSLSKIEAGKLTLTRRSFDLHELLAAVRSIVQGQAAGKGLEVAWEMDPSVPRWVSGDEGKLRQALINLLGNAVKFTEKGRVALRVRWTDGRAGFGVEDTGPGMTEEEMAQVFEAFVQTESGSHVAAGTGLGLAITREVVRLMGGDIRVSSRLGEGTTFAFDIELPLSDSAAAAEKPRVIGLAAPRESPHVLVVEDSPENRRHLVQLLRATGFTVSEAVDGARGVEEWRRGQPQLIFMDMRMPVMDGREAARRIRASENGGPRTVIVALTASAFEHERAEILAAGVDDFLTKPFSEVSLFETIARHLPVRYRYDEPAAEATPAGNSGLTAGRLKSLAPARRDALYAALAGGDFESAAAVAREIEAADPELGRELLAEMRAFRIDELLSALEAEGGGASS